MRISDWSSDVCSSDLFTPDLIVIDESRRIKGASSNASRTAARLTRLVPRRLILTGTVMPHSPMDVWAQWRFLEPMAFNEPSPHGGLKEMPFGKFEERYRSEEHTSELQ